MARYACVASIVSLVGFVVIPVVAAAQPAATPGRDASPPRDSRLGIVVLQFDDGTRVANLVVLAGIRREVVPAHIATDMKRIGVSRVPGKRLNPAASSRTH